MRAAFQNYLRKQFSAPVVDRLQTRSRRRLIAVAVVLWLALTAWFLTLIARDIVWPLIPAGIVMVYLLALLNMSNRGIFELSEEHLDEFQIARRNDAYRKAYGYGQLWLLILGFLVILLPLESPAQQILLLGVIFFAFVSGVVSPGLVAAWTAPDEQGQGPI